MPSAEGRLTTSALRGQRRIKGLDKEKTTTRNYLTPSGSTHRLEKPLPLERGNWQSAQKADLAGGPGASTSTCRALAEMGPGKKKVGRLGDPEEKDRS